MTTIPTQQNHQSILKEIPIPMLIFTVGTLLSFAYFCIYVCHPVFYFIFVYISFSYVENVSLLLLK